MKPTPDMISTMAGTAADPKTAHIESRAHCLPGQNNLFRETRYGPDEKDCDNQPAYGMKHGDVAADKDLIEHRLQEIGQGSKHRAIDHHEGECGDDQRRIIVQYPRQSHLKRLRDNVLPSRMA
jgi:hypothetical protein